MIGAHSSLSKKSVRESRMLGHSATSVPILSVLDSLIEFFDELDGRKLKPKLRDRGETYSRDILRDFIRQLPLSRDYMAFLEEELCSQWDDSGSAKPLLFGERVVASGCRWHFIYQSAKELQKETGESFERAYTRAALRSIDEYLHGRREAERFLQECNREDPKERKILAKILQIKKPIRIRDVSDVRRALDALAAATPITSDDPSPITSAKSSAKTGSAKPGVSTPHGQGGGGGVDGGRDEVGRGRDNGRDGRGRDDGRDGRGGRDEAWKGEEVGEIRGGPEERRSGAKEEGEAIAGAGEGRDEDEEELEKEEKGREREGRAGVEEGVEVERGGEEEGKRIMEARKKAKDLVWRVDNQLLSRLPSERPLHGCDVHWHIDFRSNCVHVLIPIRDEDSSVSLDGRGGRRSAGRNRRGRVRGGSRRRGGSGGGSAGERGREGGRGDYTECYALTIHWSDRAALNPKSRLGSHLSAAVRSLNKFLERRPANGLRERVTDYTVILMGNYPNKYCSMRGHRAVPEVYTGHKLLAFLLDALQVQVQEGGQDVLREGVQELGLGTGQGHGRGYGQKQVQAQINQAQVKVQAGGQEVAELRAGVDCEVSGSGRNKNGGKREGLGKLSSLNSLGVFVASNDDELKAAFASIAQYFTRRLEMLEDELEVCYGAVEMMRGRLKQCVEFFKTLSHCSWDTLRPAASLYSGHARKVKRFRWIFEVYLPAAAAVT